MASRADQMASNLNLSKFGQATELKNRIWFTIGALIVFRMLSFVPLPGVDPIAQAALYANNAAGGVLDIFNTFSGGSLERMSLIALGVMPYITASIVVQLAASLSPTLAAIKKEGESGRKKLNQYTRYGTVFLTAVQGYFLAAGLESLAAANGISAVVEPGLMFRVVATISLIGGTMFLMWLGEQITERGLGNGISILIFAGIAAGLPSAMGGLLELVRTGAMNVLVAIFIIVLVVLVTYFVVFVERGQRKILVNYARRQVGNKVYGGQSSHLPLKLNMAGVIPPIFASSIILLPTTVVSWVSTGDSTRWLRDIASALSPGQPIYVALYAAAIIFFCFFYTALVFNSRETADNLKKSGAFIPGIRPGDQTARYIDKILLRLTLAGAVYITAVCLLPEFLILEYNVPFYFGGTSLLIIVVVTMDFMAQVQNYLMSQQYESLLKKANFKTSLGN